MHQRLILHVPSTGYTSNIAFCKLYSTFLNLQLCPPLMDGVRVAA